MRVRVVAFLFLVGASPFVGASTMYSYSGINTETDYTCALELEVNDSGELTRYKVEGPQISWSPLFPISSRVITLGSWSSHPHLDRGEYSLPTRRSLIGNDIYYTDVVGGTLGYETFKLSFKGRSLKELKSLKYIHKLKLIGASLDTLSMECYELKLVGIQTEKSN